MKEIVKNCFKVALKNKFLIMGVILIPLLFAVLYVDAFWSPTDKLEDMPVAIVNLDKGATVEGEDVNYGDEIVDKILDDHSVAWKVVDADTFADGIENTDYYMAFVIDKNFSADVTAAADGDPQTGKISYLVDKRKSFILAQFGNFIRANFNDNVSQAITKKYTETIYGGLKDMTASLGKATDGSSDLNDGAKSASDGADKLLNGADQVAQGASTLSDKLSTVSEEMPTLAKGTNALYNGIATVKSGSSTISSGMSAVNSCMPTLTAGASSLASGLSTAASSLPALESGLDQVSDGASTLSSGIDSISSGLSGSTSSVNSAIDSAIALVQAGETEQAVAVLQQVEAANNAATAQINNNLAAVRNNLSTISTTAATMSGGVSTMKDQVQVMADGASSLSNGLTTLSSNISLLSGASSSLTSGVSTMYNSASSLVDGVSALTSGSNALASGAATLSSGASDVANGVATLNKGLYTLSEGTSKLTDSLADGETKLADNTKTSTDGMAKFVAQPTKTDVEIYGNVDTYGMGFAPFFISLASWIGTVLLFFVVPLRPENRLTASRWRTVFAPMPTFLLVVVIQGAIIAIGTILIGVNVNSIPLLFGMVILMSVSFAFINQLFNLMFGISGRGVAIIFLILQLCSCGGTFPVELISKFFETISPYMPFTYSVKALKEIMFGQDLSVIAFNAAVIAGCGIASVLLSLVCHRMGLRRDKLPA